MSDRQYIPKENIPHFQPTHPATNQFAPPKFKLQPPAQEVKPQSNQTPDLQPESATEDTSFQNLPDISQFRHVIPPPLPPIQMRLDLAQCANQYELEAGRSAADVDASGVQPKNQTGLPDTLKAGIENLSGVSMDDVKVHYNSPKPSQLQALAYAQGVDIHLSPGQDHLLPHEAWHTVQQKQGRVQPTMQLQGMAVNDEHALEQEADDMGSRATHRGQNHRRTKKPLLEVLSQQNIHPVIQGTFTPNVILTRLGSDTKKLKANEYKIKQLSIPEQDRPPTQFGDKQASHTVSWTLIVKSYEKAIGQPINEFISNYLLKDRNALAAQQSESPSGKLKAYLDAYTPETLKTLKDGEYSDLEWHKLLQKAISDYFVALQLAPFSTHTALERESGGYFSERPKGHGEPTANKFLANYELNLDSATKDNIIYYTTLYLDTSDWDEKGGITSVKGMAIILYKWEKSLSRTYKNIWSKYSSDIQSVSDNYPIPKDLQAEWGQTMKKHMGLARQEKYEEILPNSGTVNSPIDIDAQPINENISFTVQLDLERSDRTGEAKYPVDKYTLERIKLPDDRPPTKYWVVQKSHTVAWSLALKAMQNIKDINLKSFFQDELLPRWQILAAQDWDSITNDKSNLIKKRDLKSDYQDTVDEWNKQNRARLKQLYNLIDPNIKKLEQAVASDNWADLDWIQLTQSSIREYFEVMQSAPLTTYKAEPNPKGHGESSANSWLSWLEANKGAVADEEAWQKKFMSEIYKKRTRKGKTQEMYTVPSSHPARSIYKDLKDEEELDQNQKEALNNFLVQRLATKYLDVNWNAVDTPQEMAMVLFEWEHGLAGAYPEVWAKYDTVIQEYANDFAITKNSQRIRITKKDDSKEDRENSTMAIEMKDIRSNTAEYASRTYEVLPPNKKTPAKNYSPKKGKYQKNS